ncbi:MAG: hypothetical protein CVV02_03675 [Firmicutes bacterium HGW-Firmicutes-7]|nr:MAG: hypothetical protein CVV02_03675 [Firmicutes bacterium HGW-Firmicutes-7]
MFNQDKLSELNEAIQETINNIQEGQIYNSQIKSSEFSLSSLRAKLKNLKEQLKKEEKDVEKLQSISFENLFHSLMNNKSEKLTKEEEEVLAVKAEIDSLQYEITATQDRIQSLQQKVAIVTDAKKRYEELFQQKKAYIEAELPDKWNQIEGLTQQTQDLMLSQKEIKEALTAGDKVIHCIHGIQKSLDSAAGWGTYDIIGGGMIATMIKRDHMNQAQNEIHELKFKLTTFNQELKDVGASIDINLGINDFLGFADWFFDGFFVDLAVQSKINQAREQIMSLANKVENIIGSIKNEARLVETKTTTIHNEINELINGI